MVTSSAVTVHTSQTAAGGSPPAVLIPLCGLMSDPCLLAVGVCIALRRIPRHPFCAYRVDGLW